jgi:hypothetical protein
MNESGLIPGLANADALKQLTEDANPVVFCYEMKEEYKKLP